MSQAGSISSSGSSSTGVLTLTTDDSSVVTPSASGNINVFETSAGAGIHTTGNSGTHSVFISMESPFSNSFTFGGVSNPLPEVLTVSNTNTASNQAGAEIDLNVGGDSAGDAKVAYTVTGVQSWATGIDNSASNAYVTSASSTLGTSNVISLATSGITTISGGNVLMSKAQSGTELQIVITNTGGAAGSGTAVLLNTATAGDSYLQVQRAGTTAWTLGLDESASDAFVLSLGAVLGTTNSISINATSRDVSVVTNLTANRPIVPQSDSATFALTDRNTFQLCTKGSGMTLTVPTNGAVPFPVGTEIDIYQQGAGQVTIAFSGGVTVNSAFGNLKIATQFTGASLKKTAADVWELVGNLTA